MLWVLRCGAVGGYEILACYHPLQAYRRSDGEVVFVERGDITQSLLLPCGRCVGCRLERSRQWSVRIMHEAKASDFNAFVTLTYRDEDLPPGGSLRYRDFQLFMKRVRKWRGATRFFVCGEYGDRLGRPHFHAGLFGVCFADRKRFKQTDSGSRLYVSDQLDALWPSGFASVGDLTPESAAYMARYTFKKVTGRIADDHYRRVDQNTGEVYYVEPEFAHMSLKPGIGATWFAQYESDVYPHDRVVMRGKVGPPPRYYDQLLKRANPELLEQVQQQRILNAVDKWPDHTPERLAVREEVTKARVASFKRKLNK